MPRLRPGTVDIVASMMVYRKLRKTAPTFTSRKA